VNGPHKTELRSRRRRTAKSILGYSCADGDNPLIGKYCDIVLRACGGFV